MADNRTLTLGTIFTAKVDNTFKTTTRRLRTLILEANKAMDKFNRVSKKTTETTKKQTTVNKKAANSFTGLNRQIGKAHGGIERLKAAFKVTASYGIAARAIFAVVEAVQAGTREIIEFDQAMQNIAAITGATAGELSLMKDVMLEVANKTKFSSTEIAAGVVLLGQSGFSAGEATNAIAAAADLAAGTLSTLETTTDLLTTTIRAFNLEAIEAGRVADVMANAINKSKLTVDKIRTSFNFVGAAAAQVGLSIEETAASMALLANKGLRASTIGTGFRQVLARMIAPNRKIKEAFKEMSIELDSINPKIQGYEKAMRNLTKVLLKADGVTVDMTKAFKLFGLRGAQAVAVLASGFAGPEFDKMLENMFEVGAAEKMAAIQAKGLAFKFKNLADKAGNLAIALGDAGVAGTLRLFVDTMRSLVEVMTFFVRNPLGSMIIQFGALLALTLTLKSAFGFLAGVVTKGVIPAIAALGGPITIVIALLSAGIVAINHFATANERAKRKIEKNVEEIKRQESSLRAYIGALESSLEEIRKNNEVTRKHRALLQRLTKDHPELATVIDATVTSYEGFLEVLEKVNKEGEKSKINRARGILSLLKINAEEIIAQEEELEKLKSNLRSKDIDPERIPKDIFGSELLKRSLEGSQARVTKAHQRETELIDNLTESMINMVAASDTASLAAETFIATEVIEGRITEELAEKLTKILIPALEKMRKLRDKTGKETIENQLKEDKKAILEFESLLLSLQSDRRKRIEQEHKRSLVQFDKFKETQLEKIKDRGKNIEEEEKKLNVKIEELITASNNKRLLKLQRLGIDILKLKRKIARSIEEINLLSREKESIDNEDQLKDIENQKREHRIRLAKDDVEFAEKIHKILLASEIASNEDLLKAEADLYAKRKVLIQSKVSDAVSDLKQGKKDKDPKKSLKNISEQFKKLLDDPKKLQEVWTNVSEDVAISISSGIGGALGDIISGSKSAKEAFADLGRSMLKWLGEIIIKQTVLNALQKFKFFGGGGGDGGDIGNIAVGHKGGVVGKFHGGGIAGSPIDRSGLRSNEVLAVLEKDEGVFTKGQMKALGDRGKNITIINDFNGATFMDKRQLMDTITSVSAQISTIVAQSVAPDAVVTAYNNDHSIRRLIRSGK